MKRDSELHVEETFFEEGGAVPGHPFTLPPASRSAFDYAHLPACADDSLIGGVATIIGVLVGLLLKV